MGGCRQSVYRLPILLYMNIAAISINHTPQYKCLFNAYCSLNNRTSSNTRKSHKQR